MTARLLELESFSSSTRPDERRSSPSLADLEEARLAAYEEGYSSGWEDALGAEADDQTRIGEEFARNLRDLGFTYHEARAHVVSAMERVISEFLSVFFPAFVADALEAQVQEAMSGPIDSAAGEPIRLRVSPRDAEALGRLLVSVNTTPVVLEEEPSLASGQVFCVLGARERKIDLSAVVVATRTALDALHDLNRRTLDHG